MLPAHGVGNLLGWGEHTWGALAKADPAGHASAARTLRSFLKNYCAHFQVHASDRAMSLKAIAQRLAQTAAQHEAAGLPRERRLILPPSVAPDGTVDPGALKAATAARPAFSAILSYPLLRWGLMHVMAR